MKVWILSVFTALSVGVFANAYADNNNCDPRRGRDRDVPVCDCRDGWGADYGQVLGDDMSGQCASLVSGGRLRDCTTLSGSTITCDCRDGWGADYGEVTSSGRKAEGLLGSCRRITSGGRLRDCRAL